MAGIKQKLKAAEKKARGSGVLPYLDAHPPMFDTTKLDKSIKSMKKKKGMK